MHQDFLHSHWKPRESMTEEQARLVLWSTVIGGILAGFLILVCWVPRETSIPPFNKAHSLFVICKKPTAKFLMQLEDAHKQGVKVQLITVEKPDVEFSVTTVKDEQIPEDGALFDSTVWHYLP